MNKRQFAIISFFFLGLICLGILAACGTSGSTGSTAPTPTAASTSVNSTSSIDAAALMSQVCSHCHSLDRVTSKTKTAADWKITIDRMISHGAQLTPDQEQALINYLAQNY